MLLSFFAVKIMAIVPMSQFTESILTFWEEAVQLDFCQYLYAYPTIDNTEMLCGCHGHRLVDLFSLCMDGLWIHL